MLDRRSAPMHRVQSAAPASRTSTGIRLEAVASLFAEACVDERVRAEGLLCSLDGKVPARLRRYSHYEAPTVDPGCDRLRRGLSGGPHSGDALPNHPPDADGRFSGSGGQPSE